MTMVGETNLILSLNLLVISLLFRSLYFAYCVGQSVLFQGFINLCRLLNLKQHFSLDDLVCRSDLEHAPDEGHECLLLDEGQHGLHHEQLGKGGLRVQLLDGEGIKVSPHEKAAHGLREVGLREDLRNFIFDVSNKLYCTAIVCRLPYLVSEFVKRVARPAENNRRP